MIMDMTSVSVDHNEISSASDVSAFHFPEEDRVNLENTDEDSGILNDFDDSLGGRAMIDGGRNVTLGHMPEQDSMHLRFFNRRHSESGISIVSPVPRRPRRHSLQAPNRIHEFLPHHNNLSSREIFNRNNGSSPIRFGIGSELFINFLREEINRCNLEIPDSLLNSTIGMTAQSSDVQSEFHNLGNHLRLMADEFASSDHRRQVRERAESVPLSSLDSESFADLLFGMFQEGGVTCERILVLFAFCADLALRALREHLISCFNDVMNWSQVYIESWLTPWIQRHGGWAVVLERSVHEAYKAAIVGVCMMGILALWTYIRTARH